MTGQHRTASQDRREVLTADGLNDHVFGDLFEAARHDHRKVRLVLPADTKVPPEFLNSLLVLDGYTNWLSG